MRLLLVPSLAVLLLASPLRGAEPVATTPATGAPVSGALTTLPTIDATAPESAILLPAKVILDNDFKAFFLNMPVAEQAKAQADWKAAQGRLLDPNVPDQGIAGFNQFLGKLLAPGAETALVAEAAPSLAEMKPEEISQGLKMMAGFLPMMMMQAKGNGPSISPATQNERNVWTQVVVSLLNDASTFVLIAGINDQDRLKQVFAHLIQGAKGLGVTDAKDLQKLPLEEFLDRLKPILSESKLALGVYGVQVDGFLSSLTAVAIPADATNEEALAQAATEEALAPKSIGAETAKIQKLLNALKSEAAKPEQEERLIYVGFKAFGKQYHLPVHVSKKDNHWVLSEKNGEMLGGMKQMISGTGEAPGQELPGEAAPALIEPLAPAQAGEPAQPSVAVPITP